VARSCEWAAADSRKALVAQRGTADNKVDARASASFCVRSNLV
jgi:hypothetical protein